MPLRRHPVFNLYRHGPHVPVSRPLDNRSKTTTIGLSDTPHRSARIYARAARAEASWRLRWRDTKVRLSLWDSCRRTTRESRVDVGGSRFPTALPYTWGRHRFSKQGVLAPRVNTSRASIGRKRSWAPTASIAMRTAGLFVDGEVVEHHDVARAQRGRQDLVDVSEKRRRVDRSVEHGWRAEAVEAQCRYYRVRLPVTAGRVVPEAGAAQAAAVPAQQIRRDAAFTPETQIAARCGAAATSATAAGLWRHEGAAARRRVPFFLRVNPKRSTVRHNVLRAAVVGTASLNSVNVASGRARISAANRSSSPALRTRRRNFVLCARRDPVSRRRWISRCTHARLTSYFAATASASVPPPRSSDSGAGVARLALAEGNRCAHEITPRSCPHRRSYRIRQNDDACGAHLRRAYDTLYVDRK
jgi:hypothetical protein